MKRYNPVSIVKTKEETVTLPAEMKESDEGEWVHWDDVAELLEEVSSVLSDTRLSASVVEGQTAEVFNKIMKEMKWR